MSTLGNDSELKENQLLKKLSFSKKGFRKSKVFKVVTIIIIAAVLLGGGYFTYQKVFGGKASAKQNLTQVKRGDISIVISGSGTVEPINKYDVMALVKGDVIESPFVEGQIVNKGDLLYKINPKDIQSNIEKSKISLEKSQLSYSQNVDSIKNLKVYAPISGNITNMYVKEGDNLQNNSKVADIIDSSYMLLKVPFNSSDVSQIYVGQSAQVSLENTFMNLSGVVTKIYTGQRILDGYITVTDVEIKVKNPGALSASDHATAIVGDVACNSSGQFDYFATKTVLSQSSGTIKKIYANAGDYINANNLILEMENDSADVSLKQSKLSLSDSQVALNNMFDQMDNYNIKAPISGTITQKTSKQGDTIDNTNSNVVMATIADLSQIVFSMSIDELDISKISVGQEVSITADALSGKTFKGHVDNISINGKSSNGVTTYPVKIVIDNPEGLVPGMNVNANIVVETKSNVLKLPVSAVRRGSFVYVKDSGATGKNSETKQTRKRDQNANSSTQTGAPTANSNEGNAQSTSGAKSSQRPSGNFTVPDGFKRVQVKVGLNNKDEIEILSGLNEGDTVLLPEATVVQTTNRNALMPGMGGGTGGRPTGGGNTSTTSTNRSGSSSSSSAARGGN